MLRDRALMWVVGIIAVLTVLALLPGALAIPGNLSGIVWVVFGVGLNVVIFGGLFVLLRAGYRRLRRR